jgi:two-component system sensor histidine kinase TctE
MAKSLRRQLLAWVLLPLALAAGADAWLSHSRAAATAMVVQDRLLLGSARMIAEQIRFEDGAFQGPIPPAALELFQTEGLDRIYYRVSSGDGNILAGYSELAPFQGQVKAGTPVFQNTAMRGQTVRMVTLPQAVIGSPLSKPALVQVAQTTHAYHQLIAHLWMLELGGQAMLLFFTAALIVWGMHLGTAGLLRLCDAIAMRQDGTLNRLPTDGIPKEIVALVDALNDAIARINGAIDQRNHQLQNVAHQLQTPLTVLNTQLSDADRATSEEALHRALARAKGTLAQTSKVVRQYLQLSAAEAFVLKPQTLAVSDVAAAVQCVLEDAALLAHHKTIDLGMEVAPAQLSIQGDLLAIQEIARNLVDNALRYTPAHGTVTVQVTGRGQSIALRIEDTGPGVPLADRARIFERFVRLDINQAEGTGLGLAIVRELATQCGASLYIEEPATGRSGFCLVVQFS